jgi:integrase
MDAQDLEAMLYAGQERISIKGWLAVRDVAALSFLAESACRVGGLCSLHFDRLDLVDCTAILEEKGGHPFEAYFTEKTADFLRRWLDVRPEPSPEHGYVFVTRNNAAPMSPEVFRVAMDKLAEFAGIDGRHNPHSVRHLWGKRASDAGISPRIIQYKMGHESVTTTLENYINPDERQIRKATDDLGLSSDTGL